MRFWNACLLASVLLLGVALQETPPDSSGAESAARPKDARALFERFAKIEALEAHFTEEKHLALLALPLKSSGSIFVMRPGYLTRKVVKPEASKLTITPGELRMVDRDGTEVLDLRQNDEVRVFVTSILQVFLGDRKNLERFYAIEYTPDAKSKTAWKLVLTPKKKPLNQMLRSMRLEGEGERVTRIEIVEPNGDRTLTTITKADPKRRFSAKEKHELFGIPQDQNSPKKSVAR